MLLLLTIVPVSGFAAGYYDILTEQECENIDDLPNGDYGYEVENDLPYEDYDYEPVYDLPSDEPELAELGIVAFSVPMRYLTRRSLEMLFLAPLVKGFFTA